MAAGVVNIRSLALDLSTEERAVAWCRERGLLPKSMECPLCGALLEVRSGPRRRYGRFACNKKIAGHEIHGSFEISAASNTFFSKTRLSIPRVIMLVYGFARKFSYELITTECAEPGNSDVSNHAIADWYSYLREVCKGSLERRYRNQPQIGGPNHVVEIDECKIGGGKSKMGRVVEGKWVLGMVDRGTKEVRLELCPNNCRDSHTLLPLIRKHVAAGTSIMTDCWQGYDDMDKQNFVRQTKNHSLHFIDPVTGGSIDNIKKSWHPLRQRLTRGGVRHGDMAEHLCEYLWRMDCKHFNKDPFLQLIEDICLFYPGGIPDDCNSDYVMT